MVGQVEVGDWSVPTHHVGIAEVGCSGGLGCQLLSNYSEVTVITVFWASDFGYCLF